MKVLGSKALVLLCALLALAIVFAGWSALRKTSGTDSVDLSHAVETPRADSTDEAALPAALPEPPENLRAAEPTEVATKKERATVATNSELELADAIWFGGRVIYPAGTPLGEALDVIAKGREFKSRAMHRARVEANGNFRVAFAKGTRAGSLEIDAQHLFLAKPLSVKIKDGTPTHEVLIEPLLGGCLQGELRLPPQSEDVGPNLVGRSVSAWGWTSTSRENTRRQAIVDSALHFELRGLDPELTHTVNFDSGIFTVASLENLRVAAGETRQFSLDVHLGVRLSGKVTSPGAKLPREMHVYSRSEPLDARGVPDGSSGRANVESYAAVGDDGSFDAHGVPAGAITLRASGEQRTVAVLELGPLGDGEVREGIELALGLGGQIAGKVHWPDGEPAVGARIELVDTSESRPPGGFYLPGQKPNDIGEVLTDEQGAFAIQGLEQGPFNLVAQAKPREAGDSKRTKVPTWKAESEGVAIGTRNLELVLHGGYSVTGLVIDDQGAPIERFSVSATPAGSTGEPKPVAAARFSSKDGRFELAGLPEGTHSLEVSVLRHERPDPISIQVPAQSGPFTFVAARQASISGIVQLPDGTPAARATLVVYGDVRKGYDDGDGKANAQGEFNLTKVQPGSLTLLAKLGGYGCSEVAKLELAPGQSIEGVRLVLRVPGRITGEVHPSRIGESVSQRVVQGFCRSGTSYFDVKTDEKGLFVFENADPGEYMVRLQQSPADIRRLTPPDAKAEVQAEVVDFSTRTATVQLEEGGEAHVVFGSQVPAMVRVTGSVRRGGSPLAFVQVRAIPANAPDERDASHALADADGRFELMVAGAGSYRVEVSPNGQQGLAVGKQIDVPASGLDGVDLVVPKGRIAGRVRVNLPNSAAGRISIVLKRSETEQAWSGADTDTWPDATFKFEDLAAGKYTLMAVAWIPDSNGSPRRVLEPVTKPIELGEGQEIVDLVIEIEDR